MVMKMFIRLPVELRVLEYIQKHRGEPTDLEILFRRLRFPPEVAYSEVQQKMEQEHLIVANIRTWRLTPKGELYAETLLLIKHRSRCFWFCASLCVGLSILILLAAVT